jgi:hypothetical protein
MERRRKERREEGKKKKERRKRRRRKRRRDVSDSKMKGKRRSGGKVKVLLLSISNSNDALGLRVPGNILDLASNDLDLNLEGVLLLGGVPDADISKGIFMVRVNE